MTVDEYLNEAKKKLGITSDYAFAKKINISKQTMSSYRNGKRNPDEYMIFKIAEVLEIDAREIIASIKIETERNETRKDYWAEQLQKLKGGLSRLRIIYIMLNWLVAITHLLVTLTSRNSYLTVKGKKNLTYAHFPNGLTYA